MRTVFREWYPLSDDEQKEAFEKGTIVFDTSSLLTLYRLADRDRGRVLNLLDAIRTRVWIPYRVGYEFQRNRLRAYHEQLKAYDEIQEKLGKLSRQMFDSLPEHPVLTQEDITREIKDRLTALGRYIAEQQQSRHPSDLLDVRGQDGVRDGIDRIFEGKVGSHVEVTDKMLNDAKKRFTDKIPPGYKDDKKQEPEKFADCFIWWETLKYVSELPEGQRSLLLVLEDAKEDWWLMSPGDGARIGPRPELVREASQKGVRPFILISLRRFYDRMTEHLGWAPMPLGEFSSVADIETEADTAAPAPQQNSPEPDLQTDSGLGDTLRE